MLQRKENKMEYTDQLIRQYEDEGTRTAFHQYFDEMGIQVSNWDGPFTQMTDDGEPAIVRLDEEGQVIGFIQFGRIIMTSWFFEDRLGFIREFWVHPGYRNRGHGAQLLEKAEAWFKKQGICRMILTTDTAEKFYLRHGYQRDESIMAKNRAPVYVKTME